MPKYSVARLREFIDRRDSARSALDSATSRLKAARENETIARMNLVDLADSYPDFQGDDAAVAAQAERHDASLARVQREAEEAKNAVEAATQAKREASARLSTWAALAASAVDFASRHGFLPADLRGAF